MQIGSALSALIDFGVYWQRKKKAVQSDERNSISLEFKLIRLQSWLPSSKSSSH
jgi:hypothetical protein